LNLDYFDYCTGLTMTNAKFDELFGDPPRKPEVWLTQREMDFAASIQAVTEEVVLRLTRPLAKETGQRNLCLAGGVALNCVANGKVLRDGHFKDLWIQPAADSGAIAWRVSAHRPGSIAHPALEVRTPCAPGTSLEHSPRQAPGRRPG
jgi:carbamoyltransferase